MILVRYAEVASQTQALRSQLQSEFMEMNAAYQSALTSLVNMDGMANGEILAAMQANQEKARLASEILTKLLEFIEISSQQVEITEQNIVRFFQSVS